MLTFRITRNADLALHEEGAEDLLKVIEEELKKRKWGRTVRLEVEEETVDEEAIQFLLEELEIHEKDAYRVEICFPVYDDSHKEKIKQALLLLLNDNVKAREQDPQGNYHYVPRQAEEPEINSQEQLCKRAFQAAEAIE